MATHSLKKTVSGESGASSTQPRSIWTIYESLNAMTGTIFCTMLKVGQTVPMRRTDASSRSKWVNGRRGSKKSNVSKKHFLTNHCQIQYVPGKRKKSASCAIWNASHLIQKGIGRKLKCWHCGCVRMFECKVPMTFVASDVKHVEMQDSIHPKSKV